MSDQTPFPSMDELMARVGFLLLHWGWLENDLRSMGHDAPSAHAPDSARRVRNLVVHGMFEASADQLRAPEPFLTCRASDGEEERVTYSDLLAAIEEIERHRVNLRRSGA